MPCFKGLNRHSRTVSLPIRSSRENPKPIQLPNEPFLILAWIKNLFILNSFHLNLNHDSLSLVLPRDYSRTIISCATGWKEPTATSFSTTFQMGQTGSKDGLHRFFEARSNLLKKDGTTEEETYQSASPCRGAFCSQRASSGTVTTANKEAVRYTNINMLASHLY